MLPLEDTNSFFNECKIILGVGTVCYCEDFYALKLRDFDAPLSGSCYVTHDNSDLHALFEKGKEVILCKNINEYVDKIKYLLSSQDELRRVSKLGLKRALSEHTYEERLKKLFKTLGVKINE